jgi:hypothetical protein
MNNLVQTGYKKTKPNQVGTQTAKVSGRAFRLL